MGHISPPSVALRDTGSVDPRAILLGFPSDEGVKRSGGRVGVAHGPHVLRTALYHLAPDARLDHFEALLRRTRDLGNLDVTGEVESDQRTLGEKLAPHLDQGTFVIVLGGGHETSSGHFLGYVLAGKPVEILNWDARRQRGLQPLLCGRSCEGGPSLAERNYCASSSCVAL